RMKRVLFILSILLTTSASAQSYYYGTYNPPETGSGNSEPAQETAPPAGEPPPVVYRRARVYRPVVRAPDWAGPNAAALGPWPWNFDFGGGPATVSGSHDQLTGGSNFQFGGGYNFSPRAGLVLEFGNAWLGVTNNALQQNGAFDGDANVWSVTLN